MTGHVASLPSATTPHLTLRLVTDVQLLLADVLTSARLGVRIVLVEPLADPALCSTSRADAWVVVGQHGGAQALRRRDDVVGGARGAGGENEGAGDVTREEAEKKAGRIKNPEIVARVHRYGAAADLDGLLRHAREGRVKPNGRPVQAPAVVVPSPGVLLGDRAREAGRVGVGRQRGAGGADHLGAPRPPRVAERRHGLAGASRTVGVWGPSRGPHMK